jgi:hypothetical protein
MAPTLCSLSIAIVLGTSYSSSSMNLTPLFQAIGSAGLFSSRVFLPALLSALLLRFGIHIPFIDHTNLVSHATHTPTWFTSNLSITILAILSVAEIFAQKNPETRRLLQEFDVYLKVAMALLTSFGVINATDASFVQQTVHQAGFENSLIPLISALGTWRIAIFRRDVMNALLDHLEGTHLDTLISWLEEAWVFFGMFLLVLFPLLMLLMIGIATGVLYLLRKRLEIREDQTRIACTQCGSPIYACAIACPQCRQTISQPTEIGFLGQSQPFPTTDLPNHPYRLVEKRRCPRCASRLKTRDPFHPCPACADLSRISPEFSQAYINYITQRLPLVLGVSFLMSLVPIIGLIVGTIYYRMELVLPFSQYLPLGRRFFLRWGIRLLFLLMILLQVIPIIGGFVVPLMAFISFTAYRESYRSLLAEPRPELVPIAQTKNLTPGY